jgi:hypothetical protein
MLTEEFIKKCQSSVGSTDLELGRLLGRLFIHLGGTKEDLKKINPWLSKEGVNEVYNKLIREFGTEDQRQSEADAALRRSRDGQPCGDTV